MFDSLTLRTTTFWIEIASQVAIVLAILAGSLPAEQGIIASGLSALFYTVARTITKYRGEFKRGWHATEFWIAGLSVALAGVETLQGEFGAAQFAGVALVLSTAIQISRALVTARHVDTV